MASINVIFELIKFVLVFLLKLRTLAYIFIYFPLVLIREVQNISKYFKTTNLMRKT